MSVESAAKPSHPVLDDRKKMMRIIANPLYDQLTISRAAHIRQLNPAEYDCKLPLSTNKKEVNLHSVTERQNLSFDRNTPQGNPTGSTSTQSFTTTNCRNPPTTGTVRYVKSRHGFEIHRYSSSNCLSVHLLSKDACQDQEKTFREMLEKQEQHALLPREIYTLDYYRQRYEDLLQSYKQGHLTHDQWAEQNYQLHCLKTLYTQAFNREQYYLDLFARNQRQRHAQHVFKQWKDAKAEGKSGCTRNRSKTSDTQQATEMNFVSSNPSFSLRSHTTNRLSSSTFIEDELDEPSVGRPTNSSQDSFNALYMLDNRRSSLQAMLKRVVGLAEPLRPSPKILTRLHSSKTSVMEHSAVESSI